MQVKLTYNPKLFKGIIVKRTQITYSTVLPTEKVKEEFNRLVLYYNSHFTKEGEMPEDWDFLSF